jgi:hypothetical protein
MLQQTGEGPTLTLNPARIDTIKAHGSYFGERQVRVMGELADYVNQHGELPTTDKLIAFVQRPETEVRNDLNGVTLEGFLWVFGVEG